MVSTNDDHHDLLSSSSLYASSFEPSSLAIVGAEHFRRPLAAFYCTFSTLTGVTGHGEPSIDAIWALVTGHGEGMLLDFGGLGHYLVSYSHDFGGPAAPSVAKVAGVTVPPPPMLLKFSNTPCHGSHPAPLRSKKYSIPLRPHG